MKVWTSEGIRTRCKKPFRCTFCNKIEKLSYSIVDGQKSCRRCDREYSAVEVHSKVKCPICKGKGYLSTDTTEDKGDL